MAQRELLPFVSNNNTWGFIDAEGTWVIPPIYQGASHFSGEFALVKKGKYVGFVNKSGQEVIPCIYFDSLGFWEGSAAVAMIHPKSGSIKWGVIDTSGNWMVKPEYDFVGPMFQNRARYNTKGRWGYLDSKGKVLIAPRYDWAGDYIDGLARVQEVAETLKTYYIDPRAQQLGTHFFENGEDFCNGMAPVFEKGKWGVINKQGQLIIPHIYASVGEFTEGKIPVSLDGSKWFYVDSTGTRCIQSNFQQAHPFQDKCARVVAENKWGFINDEGQWLLPPTFDFIEDFCQGWALFRQGDKAGYINKAGLVIKSA